VTRSYVCWFVVRPAVVGGRVA